MSELRRRNSRLRSARALCGALLLSACGRFQAEVGSEKSPETAGRCDADAPLKLYYWNARPQESSALIDYLVKVENASGAAIPASSIEIRYYLSNELPSAPFTDVYYSDTCCSHKTLFNDRVLTSLVPISARPGADAYLQIGFSTELTPLAAGDAIQVEVGLHDSDTAFRMTQSNDYSFDASAVGAQSDWDACPGRECLPAFTSCKLVVLRDGIAVWGTPP